MEDEIVPQSFVDIASSIKRLKMFPYFEVAHYILTCLLVRDDTYSLKIAGPKGFHRNHPLACYVGCMMLCFANSLVGNLLLGEPLLLTFDNEINIVIASVVWYLVNYSSFDVVYHFAKFVPVRIILMMMQEMLRLNRIYEGINFATTNFSGALLFVCIFGTLKGSASLHIRMFQRLLCGKWLPGSLELFNPTPVSKSSFVAGICFTLQRRGLVEFSDPLFYFSLIFFLCLVRFFWVVFGVDVFKLFENILGFLFFGGVLDWIDRRRRRSEGDKLAMDAAKLMKKHK